MNEGNMTGARDQQGYRGILGSRHMGVQIVQAEYAPRDICE